MSQPRMNKVLLLAAVASLACVRNKPASVPNTAAQVEYEHHFSLTVDNQNFYDATVYAVASGGRSRVGIVGGNTSGKFTLNWIPTTEYVFEVRLLAVGAFMSESIQVDPGDHIEVTIPHDLHRRRPGESGHH